MYLLSDLETKNVLNCYPVLLLAGTSYSRDCYSAARKKVRTLIFLKNMSGVFWNLNMLILCHRSLDRKNMICNIYQ